MSNAVITRESGLEVTAISRLKHTALYEAAKAFGSARALARHLGVTPQVFGRWANLQGSPPKDPIGPWSKQRVAALVSVLFQVTGEVFVEMFPDFLRPSGFRYKHNV